MRLISRSPEETEDIGFRLGKILKAGDVVGLYGELGTGKTTMAKGIAGAFGIAKRDITSASFTIIAEYESDPTFYHIDLYRIGEGDDLDATGVWECMGSDSVSVIEWAEIAEDGFPEHAIKMKMKAKGDDLREITIEGINEEDWNNL
ncbi:MAG: tRNA (adenosine(37)-N6)-threonylcarbamoyltransferase complex ATPase subunit type 1 TsaE [Nitrospirota bacterium]|nr:tRNA (adenosine(37)-N6)-threonylcarbamoyltransferase complex ATPase subunit type 1 TsaE [Nitrospirota bacterium]